MMRLCRSALPLWWLTMAAALLLHARPPSGTSPLLRLRAALPTCREEGDEISFGDLQVRGVLASRLLEENFKVATPIQSAAMMPIHRGENAVLHAETGSGKTLAYLLPIISSLKPTSSVQALVLLPTRELATQVARAARQLHLDLARARREGGGAEDVAQHAHRAREQADWSAEPAEALLRRRVHMLLGQHEQFDIRGCRRAH